MKRRIVIVTLVTLGFVGLGSGAQALGGNTTQSSQYWGCAGVQAVDKAICVKNPLPEQLPLPTTPSTPTPG
jgi:hypothetical protein